MMEGYLSSRIGNIEIDESSYVCTPRGRIEKQLERRTGAQAFWEMGHSVMMLLGHSRWQSGRCRGMSEVTDRAREVKYNNAEE